MGVPPASQSRHSALLPAWCSLRLAAMYASVVDPNVATCPRTQHPHRRLRHLLAVSARNLLLPAADAGAASGAPLVDRLACGFLLWSWAGTNAAAPTLVHESELVIIRRPCMLIKKGPCGRGSTANGGSAGTCDCPYAASCRQSGLVTPCSGSHCCRSRSVDAVVVIARRVLESTRPLSPRAPSQGSL